MGDSALGCSLYKFNCVLVSGGGIAVGSASEILKELSIKDYELRQDRKKLDWNKFSEDEKKILMTLENDWS